mgnify:CR=1 FL=1
MAKSVFYSFHYKRDVHRVQLVRNIDALEGQPVLSGQDWEAVRRQGDQAIEKWIDEQMKYKEAVIVLIGAETANRPWVQYEIAQAWKIRIPLLGIKIHGLASLSDGADEEGPDNFFADYSFRIPVFDPTVYGWIGIDTKATYNNLADNIEQWSREGATRW